jgi:hypothetical protein
MDFLPYVCPKAAHSQLLFIGRSAVCFKSSPRVGRFLAFRLPGNPLSAKPQVVPGFRKAGIV